jgi:hypothetical protein
MERKKAEDGFAVVDGSEGIATFLSALDIPAKRKL